MLSSLYCDLRYLIAYDAPISGDVFADVSNLRVLDDLAVVMIITVVCLLKVLQVSRAKHHTAGSLRNKDCLSACCQMWLCRFLKTGQKCTCSGIATQCHWDSIAFQSYGAVRTVNRPSRSEALYTSSPSHKCNEW